MLALSVPEKRRFAYGFWRYREDEIDDAVEMLVLARESGIDHFDTADIYGGSNGFGGSERFSVRFAPEHRNCSLAPSLPPKSASSRARPTIPRGII